MKIYSTFSRVLPYLLLLYLSFWQAFELLEIEDSNSLKILAAFSTFLFYLLLVQINQKLLKITLIITFLIVCFVYPSLNVYGRFDSNYIAGILYTNNSEALSYIKIIPTHCYLKLLEYLLCTVAILVLNIIKIRWAFLKYTLLLVFLIPSIFAYKSFRDQQLDKVWFTHIAPIKYSILIWHLVDQVKEQNDNIIQESKKKDSWHILNKDGVMLKKNFVIVIGESVRRDFLHCYGFPVENTPFIESSPHIQFDNYISAGTHTIPSLTRTLAYPKHFPDIDLPNNIVKLAKKAGYETYWISNQGYIGFYDSPISIIANASDHYYRATGGNFTVAKEDTDILPIIAKTIENNNNSKVIFIHMRGSHPSAYDRTKG